MLAEKTKEVQHQRGMQALIKQGMIFNVINRVNQVFTRERDMKDILDNLFPIIFRIKMRLRKRLTGISRDINRRKEVEIKNVSQAMTCMMRMTVRERAKDVMLSFLQKTSQRDYICA